MANANGPGRECERTLALASNTSGGVGVAVVVVVTRRYGHAVTLSALKSPSAMPSTAGTTREAGPREVKEARPPLSYP